MVLFDVLIFSLDYLQYFDLSFSMLHQIYSKVISSILEKNTISCLKSESYEKSEVFLKIAIFEYSRRFEPKWPLFMAKWPFYDQVRGRLIQKFWFSNFESGIFEDQNISLESRICSFSPSTQIRSFHHISTKRKIQVE